jgi:hypothetical protein
MKRVLRDARSVLETPLRLDANAARAIAEAVFVRVYGEGVLERGPFVAESAEQTCRRRHIYCAVREWCELVTAGRSPHNHGWHVRGTRVPEKFGGVPELILRDSDGAVLLIGFGK